MDSAEQPLVSVITPAYNCEKYLERCIASVRSQRFTDWEMVIVDDGSSDSTFDVASGHAAHDPRIKVLRHPVGQNRGVSPSRNLAIEVSRGSLLAFLDADDEWLPNKLERQVSVFHDSPEVDLSFAKVRCVDGEGMAVRHPDWPQIEWVLGHAPGPGPVERPFVAFVGATIGIQIPTVVARRQAVVAADGFPLGLQFQVEDSVLWAKICRGGSTIYFVDEVLGLYRVHPENFTSSLDPIGQTDAFWELYTRLADDVDSPEPELVSAMLECVDRYLTAWGAPMRQRWQHARSRALSLTESAWLPAARVRFRFLSAPVVGLKRRLMIWIRRMLKTGPVPWTRMLRP